MDSNRTPEVCPYEGESGHMAKAYRKAAPKPATERTMQRYGGVVRLAAEISGRSIWTVYGVISGRVKSARVQEAIDEAKLLLLPPEGEAA